MMGKFNDVLLFIVSNNLTKVYLISNSSFELLYITLLVIRENLVLYLILATYSLEEMLLEDIVKKSKIFLTSVT